MKKQVVNVPLTQEIEDQSKVVHRAALKHWFARTQEPRRAAWPVIPEFRKDSQVLACPPGVNRIYWENLSKTEQRWNTPAAQVKAEDQRSAPCLHTPTIEERRRLWQQLGEIQASKQAKQAETDYFTQAIRPADPFEEPIKRPSRVRRIAADQNVVPFEGPESEWREAVNE